jgi:hypothetical protein
MAINFPNNPTLNQTFVVGDSVYSWNGTSWRATSSGLITDEIDETIKSYQVAPGSTITAGKFVDYINGSIEKNLLTLDTNSGYGDVLKLLDNKLLIASKKGTARIITINSDNSITSSQEYTFFNSIGNLTKIKLLKISENRAVVIFINNEDEEGYAKILDISGTVVSPVSGDTNIGFGAQMRHLSADLFDTNKIVISYSATNSSEIGRAQILTVGESSITQSSLFTFANHITRNTYIVSMSSTSAMVAYQDATTSDQVGKARMLNLSASSPTSLATVTTFNTFHDTYAIRLVKLSADTVIASYWQGVPDERGEATLLLVNGTSIVVGGSVIFDTRLEGTYESLDMIRVSDDKAMVVYQRDNLSGSDPGIAKIITRNGLKLTVGDGFTFNNNCWYPSIEEASKDSYFIHFVTGGFSNSDTALSMILYEKKLITDASSQRVFGLAKTSGEENETVEIYVNE